MVRRFLYLFLLSLQCPRTLFYTCGTLLSKCEGAISQWPIDLLLLFEYDVGRFLTIRTWEVRI